MIGIAVREFGRRPRNAIWLLPALTGTVQPEFLGGGHRCRTWSHAEP